MIDAKKNNSAMAANASYQCTIISKRSSNGVHLYFLEALARGGYQKYHAHTIARGNALKHQYLYAEIDKRQCRRPARETKCNFSKYGSKTMKSSRNKHHKWHRGQIAQLNNEAHIMRQSEIFKWHTASIYQAGAGNERCCVLSIYMGEAVKIRVLLIFHQ